MTNDGRYPLPGSWEDRNTQFNLPPQSKKLTYAANRTSELLDRFTDPSTRLIVSADLAMINRFET